MLIVLSCLERKESVGVLEIFVSVTWTDIEPVCKWRLTFILWNCSSIFFIVFSSVQKSKYLPLKIIDVVLVGFRINKQFRACIRLSYFQLPISILHEDHWSVKLKYIFNFEGWWWYDEGMSSQQGFIRHRPIWNTQNNDRRNKLYKLNIKT